jgi:hypothetical protein
MHRELRVLPHCAASRGASSLPLSFSGGVPGWYKAVESNSCSHLNVLAVILPVRARKESSRRQQPQLKHWLQLQRIVPEKDTNTQRT